MPPHSWERMELQTSNAMERLCNVLITYHSSHINPLPILTPHMVATNIGAREYGTDTKPCLWEIVGRQNYIKTGHFQNVYLEL
jgi:hypothetical protein